MEKDARCFVLQDHVVYDPPNVQQLRLEQVHLMLVYSFVKFTCPAFFPSVILTVVENVSISMFT